MRAACSEAALGDPYMAPLPLIFPPGAVPGAGVVLLRRHVPVAPAQAARRRDHVEALHQGAASPAADRGVPQHLCGRQRYVLRKVPLSLTLSADSVNNAALALVCLHRAPHEEAAAAGLEPAGPSVTTSQPGHFEGKFLVHHGCRATGSK